MHISIVYALANEQFIESLDVAEGTTAEEALQASTVLEKYPEIDLAVNKLGIYAKLVKGTQILENGDRLEIYRPLPRKPRDAHAVEDKKARIRARKESRTSDEA